MMVDIIYEHHITLNRPNRIFKEVIFKIISSLVSKRNAHGLHYPMFLFLNFTGNNLSVIK